MPKQNFEFRTPLLNAAGFLGYWPDPRCGLPMDAFGAFITNPISYTARQPAAGGRFASFPGGAVLHSGHPNPGIKNVLRLNRKRWARAELPVIVHLLAGDPQELQSMLMMLEEAEGVMGVELRLPPRVDIGTAVELVSAALGELPLMVHLPLSDAVLYTEAVIDAGASAVSIGPPRGTLPVDAMGLLHGQLYGPALFPQTLQAVSTLAGMGIPVVGGGGVYDLQQVNALISAGASAVQLDMVLWCGEWDWLTADLVCP